MKTFNTMKLLVVAILSMITLSIGAPILDQESQTTNVTDPVDVALTRRADPARVDMTRVGAPRGFLREGLKSGSGGGEGFNAETILMGTSIHLCKDTGFKNCLPVSSDPTQCVNLEGDWGAKRLTSIGIGGEDRCWIYDRPGCNPKRFEKLEVDTSVADIWIDKDTLRVVIFGKSHVRSVQCWREK
ncbi:hypothetical protein EJ08DRAFT_702692 [Tothia fuscella]|uniref:Uncharacterized protein n=1 Tax=Tothia fuscella TaxID=1048955 RepID=A0A9P4NG95_9PEZI|nr:hypothetical protein EJ08DRAFT_702692 [Tothia fuscella]